MTTMQNLPLSQNCEFSDQRIVHMYRPKATIYEEAIRNIEAHWSFKSNSKSHANLVYIYTDQVQRMLLKLLRKVVSTLVVVLFKELATSV